MKIEDKEDQEFINIIKELIEGVTVEEIAKKKGTHEYFISEILRLRGCKYDRKENMWYAPIRHNTIVVIDECIEMITKETLLDRVAKIADEGL